MEFILAIVGKLVAHPVTSLLGVSTIGLGLFAGAEHLDIAYKSSQISTLQNTIEADQLALKNWQTKFTQLSSLTDQQNTEIAALKKQSDDLTNKIADSNSQIDNYEKELADDAKKIAAQVVPNDCPAALNVLVNNVKTNVSRLKIERPNR